MNRIILIGNGFDLAHGMKTSYNNFINNYWENAINEIKEYIHKSATNFENEEIKIKNIPWSLKKVNDFEKLKQAVSNNKSAIQFKNKFLEVITHKKEVQNWVDIEQEYYDLLKSSLYSGKIIENTRIEMINENRRIKQLNTDFKRVKDLLEIYLKKVENEFNDNFDKTPEINSIKQGIGLKIYSDFKIKDFTEFSVDNLVELEYSKIKNDIKGLEDNLINLNELNDRKISLVSKIKDQDPKTVIKKLLKSDMASNYFTLKPNEILFLNFNYTFTEKFYKNHIDFEPYEPYKNLEKKFIHIHGTTDKYDNNDIIFGYGDELDKDYNEIENLNIDEYLENIKSIKYLETNNYKNLLEFINSGNYQVCIFGHSCGISDRTLLNTLFEHENCCSIKPYYHKREDSTDNYSDIIRNISRNFNNKASMRDKVVNKSYCEPLCD